MMPQQERDRVGRDVNRVARAAVVALAAVASLSGPASGQSKPWTITSFQVANVEPLGMGPGGRLEELEKYALEVGRFLGYDGEFGLRTVDLDPETKRAMEDYLTKVAHVLEGWGFPQPLLEPVVETEDGREAYRVYLVTGIPGRSGEYRPVCLTGNEAIILLDAADVLDAHGHLKPTGTATLAHELFHAVQFNTRFFSGDACGTQIGDWIVEGSAEAIGWDVAMRLQQAPIAGEDEEVWGARNYQTRLPVPLRHPHDTDNPFAPADPAYRTSSLWRYLAELFAAFTVEGAAPPGPAAGPVDYTYLQWLFSNSPVARDCSEPDSPCDAEVAWLDDGLVSLFGVGLRALYPQFMAVYARYGDFRAPKVEEELPGVEPGQDWRALAFNDACALVELRPHPDSLTYETAFSLAGVAAECWDVDVRRFGGPIAVGVEVRAPGPVLSQLSVGEASSQNASATFLGGGVPVSARVDTAVVATGQGSGGARATWTFPFPDGGPTPFLVSNVAHEARETHALHGATITFTAQAFATVQLSGALTGEYDILPGRHPYFGIAMGSKPHPEACTLWVNLVSDIGDALTIGGALTPPLRVGTRPIANGYGGGDGPPVGSVAISFVPSGRRPGVSYEAGLPRANSVGGTFEITAVGPSFVAGRFVATMGGGEPYDLAAQFVLPPTDVAGFSRLAPDHPCIQPGPPGAQVVG